MFRATSVRFVSSALRASSSRRVVQNLSRAPVQTSFITKRSYSSDQDEESKRLEKLVTDLRTNPKIATALEDFQALLLSKGFQPDKKPSMMQMMSILMDKEIKAAIAGLKKELEAANISFSQKDVDAFMKLFGMNMK